MIPAAPTPAFFPSSRALNVTRLAADIFDVLIIGGGVNGAGVARDLGLRIETLQRAMNVALVDKGYFSSGTSGRNSQLIHGGLRYLKNLEFGLVREALDERATLLRIAPHLVEPLGFLIPYLGSWSKFYYGAGVKIYDHLAGKRNIAPHEALSAADVARLEPGMTGGGITGGSLYWDGRVHSARLVLENVFDAARSGVVVANYVEAGTQHGGFPRERDYYTVPARDRLTGQVFFIRSRRIVDARGPWEGGQTLRLVRGSHIIVPKVNASNHAIAHFNPDGRILFIIPWGTFNDLSLIGTTDIEHKGTADDVRITQEEVRYLQASVRALYPQAKLDPIAAYSSLRPLVGGKGSASKNSRTHRIWLEDDGNLLKIAGGKYTTYRSMSREAVDLLIESMWGKSKTAEVALGGNTPDAFAAEMAKVQERAGEYALDPREVGALTRLFGRQVDYVLSMVPVKKALLPRWKSAAVAHCAKHEMVVTLADFLRVNTYWGYEEQLDAASVENYAKELGFHLGWVPSKIAQEIATFLSSTKIAG